MPVVILCPSFGVGYQGFTSGGLPLNAGLIYTYIAGGTTPQATYTTSAGNVQNANPIVLDADGRTPSEVWLLDNSVYRFDVKDSLDNLLKSYDNIYGIPDWQSSEFLEIGYLTSVAGTNTITATSTEVISAYVAGQKFQFLPANTNTGATTINIDGVGAKNVFWNGIAMVGGELRQNIAVGIIYDGTQFQVISNGFNAPFLDTHPIVEGSADSTKKARIEVDGQTTALTRVMTTQDQNFTLGSLARSYLAGCTLSTAGSSATMSIAAGQCSDSTNVAMMVLAAIAKTTSAWSVGTAAGGLDTGAIANSTWYHFYVIMRLDTGVVDVTFSTNATTPTLPANYTLYRRIGSGKTDGSAQWTLFVQYGDLFQWSTRPADVSANNPGTSAVTRTLTVPTGVVVEAITQTIVSNVGAGGNSYCVISNLSVTDASPGTALTDTSTAVNFAGGAQHSAAVLRTITNTSAQVRSRLSFSNADVTLTMNTQGWIDRRGRDA